MIKEFLKENNISIYMLSKQSGIPYSTLNDIVNYKVDISNIRAGILFKLSEILNISMDELYRLCSNEIIVCSEEYSIKGKVLVKNKKYILYFQYNNQEYIDELCMVKKEASLFIDSIAKWQMEKHIADIKMDEEYNRLSNS